MPKVLGEKYIGDSHFALVSYRAGLAHFVLDGKRFGPYEMPRAETTFRTINSIEDFRKTIPDIQVKV